MKNMEHVLSRFWDFKLKLRFGCPLEIYTDHRRNFESELFKEICELLEIGKTRTTSYRPSANGQVERYNRSIAQIIRCCIEDRQERWDDFVGIAVGAIRATVNRSTGFTPNRMMLGRGYDALDLMLGSDGEEAKRRGTFRANFKDGWVEAHRKTRETLEGVQRRQKKYYDLRKRTTIYEVGDVVLKKNNAGQEIVDEIPGGDGGHSQEDEGSLADAE